MGDHRPWNSVRYEWVAELLAWGKNRYWVKFVATASFMTEVDHQATSKMDDTRLSVEHFKMYVYDHTLSWVGREGFFAKMKDAMFRINVRTLEVTPKCWTRSLLFHTSWPAWRCPGIYASRWATVLRSCRSAQLSRFAITQPRDELFSVGKYCFSLKCVGFEQKHPGCTSLLSPH